MGHVGAGSGHRAGPRCRAAAGSAGARVSEATSVAGPRCRAGQGPGLAPGVANRSVALTLRRRGSRLGAPAPSLGPGRSPSRALPPHACTCRGASTRWCASTACSCSPSKAWRPGGELRGRSWEVGGGRLRAEPADAHVGHHSADALLDAGERVPPPPLGRAEGGRAAREHVRHEPPRRRDGEVGPAALPAGGTGSSLSFGAACGELPRRRQACTRLRLRSGLRGPNLQTA